jgi:hypothetical protein
MNQLLKKLAISASLAVGVTAIATNPAQAGTLTGVTIGGTDATNYYVYDVSGNNTVLVPSNLTNVQKVLDGNAASPTGNVELAANSELSSFNFLKNTTLSGQIGGKALTLSSLTATDWFGATLNTSYGANTLATKWFNDFLVKAGKGNIVGTSTAASAFNLFGQLRGFQRTSDPNISYVNQDDATGEIKIGLAGHFDLKAYYSQPNSGFATLAALLPNGFQASEVVKYTYNGKTDFLYSFFATSSGLTANVGTDRLSHSGNYEVTIPGVPPAKTPEPSVMLGVLGVAGMFAAQRKLRKVSF